MPPPSGVPGPQKIPRVYKSLPPPFPRRSRCFTGNGGGLVPPSARFSGPLSARFRSDRLRCWITFCVKMAQAAPVSCPFRVPDNSRFFPAIRGNPARCGLCRSLAAFFAGSPAGPRPPWPLIVNGGPVRVPAAGRPRPRLCAADPRPGAAIYKARQSGAAVHCRGIACNSAAPGACNTPGLYAPCLFPLFRFAAADRPASAPGPVKEGFPLVRSVRLCRFPSAPSFQKYKAKPRPTSKRVGAAV